MRGWVALGARHPNIGWWDGGGEPLIGLRLPKVDSNPENTPQVSNFSRKSGRGMYVLAGREGRCRPRLHDLHFRCGVWGMGFEFWGLGLGVWCVGFRFSVRFSVFGFRCSGLWFRVHTVVDQPCTKSQLAWRNQLWGLVWCKSKHVALNMVSRRTPPSPPCLFFFSITLEPGVE